MSRFKPQVSYITKTSLENYYNSYKPVSRYITKQYKTYVDLKKDLQELCKENIDDDGVYVVRSKRGEWGEWGERWKTINGKPTIVKEGWS